MIFTVFISGSVVHYALCLRVHTGDAVVPGATTGTVYCVVLLLLTVAFQRLSLKDGAQPPTVTVNYLLTTTMTEQ